MKWSIENLRKKQFPYSFEEQLEFTDEENSCDDLIKINPVTITGKIYMIDFDTFRFVYHIHAPLVLECSITLDPVDYVIDNDYDEIYSTVKSDEVFLIEKNTIDTKVMVWSNILIDKPINYSKPDAYEILKERGISLDDVPEDMNDEVVYYSDGLEKSDIPDPDED